MTAAPAFPSRLTLCFQGWEGLPWLAHHARTLEPPAGRHALASSATNASGSCQAKEPEPETWTSPFCLSRIWGPSQRIIRASGPQDKPGPFFSSPET